jgi:hypothetical protein
MAQMSIYTLATQNALEFQHKFISVVNLPLNTEICGDQGVALETAHARGAEELEAARKETEMSQREVAAARTDVKDLEQGQASLQERLGRARAEIGALQAALEVTSTNSKLYYKQHTATLMMLQMLFIQ